MALLHARLPEFLNLFGMLAPHSGTSTNVNIILRDAKHPCKNYLDEVDQHVVDVCSVGKEETASWAQIMEEKQLLLLKMIKKIQPYTQQNSL